MTTDAQNPLLDFSGLARFDAIKPEHVTPAIDDLLAKSRAVVEHYLTASPCGALLVDQNGGAVMFVVLDSERCLSALLGLLFSLY